METIIAKATKSAPAPDGYKGRIVVTARAYQLGGNQHPHFAVTAEIGTARQLESGDIQACGCLHEEALAVWPAVAPIVALHLSNADDGEPRHAVANGFYNLAGTVAGNFGEQYHLGNSARHFPITPEPETPWKKTESRFPTCEEAVTLTAEYLRCDVSAVEAIRERCLEAYATGANSVASSDVVSPVAEKALTKAGNAAAKAEFAKFIDTLRPAWLAEAQNGLALIRQLGSEAQ